MSAVIDARHCTDADLIAEFRAELAAAGLDVGGPILADDRVRRLKANGEARSSLSYKLRIDSTGAVGWFRCHKSGETHRFSHGARQPLSGAQRRQHAGRMERFERERRESEQARYERVARRAEAILAGCAQLESHEYLRRKGLNSEANVYRGGLVVGGMRCDGALMAPLRDIDRKLWSLEFVAPNGEKRFLPGGRKAGCFARMGFPREGEPESIIVCEGVATGISISMAVDAAVAVAFDGGNLLNVATALRKRYPNKKIIIAADDDSETEAKTGVNPGISKAREAARTVGGCVATPSFGDDRPAGVSDFDDLRQLRGLEAVRRCLAAAQPVVAVAPAGVLWSAAPSVGGASEAAEEWGEPEELVSRSESDPYPIDALPPIMRAAVNEGVGFTQSPVALAACSALAAISIASQALVNVRRDSALSGPISIYALTVADSGERKSTVDGIFGRVLHEFEASERERMAVDVARSMAEHAAWEAKRDGMKERIKRAVSKSGRANEEDEKALSELMENEPAIIRPPRLIYTDVTPESLAHKLSSGWPSGGMQSAEGGAVLGAHGMGAETVSRNLALLNSLWSGEPLAVDRRTSESFLLRGRRLSVALMIQPAALADFMERVGTQARGTGFLARFLIAWPTSTQGARKYREAPARMPAMDRFSAAVRDLLQTPLSVDAQGCLTPPELELGTQARKVWVEFFNAIESELGAAGELQGMRDFGARSAEQAARIAALFHIIEHGRAGPIGAETMEAACAVVDWHLGEAKRLLGEFDMPTPLRNAVRLDGWLVARARAVGASRFRKTEVMQHGPACIRDKKAIEAAVTELQERGRARIAADGRRQWIEINPALLKGEA